jgi:hypothetical protein
LVEPGPESEGKTQAQLGLAFKFIGGPTNISLGFAGKDLHPWVEKSLLHKPHCKQLDDGVLQNKVSNESGMFDVVKALFSLDFEL